METTFVYLMRAEGFIKIGVTSRSLRIRASEVQTGCPLPIEDIGFYTFTTKQEAYDMEAKLHSEFSQYSSHGEWIIEFRSWGAKIDKAVGKGSEWFRFKYHNHTEHEETVRAKRLARKAGQVMKRVIKEASNNQEDMTIEEHTKLMEKKHQNNQKKKKKKKTWR